MLPEGSQQAGLIECQTGGVEGPERKVWYRAAVMVLSAAPATAKQKQDPGHTARHKFCINASIAAPP